MPLPRLVPVLVAAVLAAAAAPARAGDPPWLRDLPGDPGWHLTLAATTDFPVSVGGRVLLETPYRLRVTSGVGVLPGPYVDAINGIVVGLGGYDADVARLVRSTLQESLLWRTHLGWRPFKGRGFYFEAGYGLATLGGGATSADLIKATTGITPPASEASRSYSARATVHLIDVEVGWDWVLWRTLHLWASVGFAGTVGASVSVSPRFTPAAPRKVAQFTASTETYLEDVFTHYVFTPVASVGVGWRVF